MGRSQLSSPSLGILVLALLIGCGMSEGGEKSRDVASPDESPSSSNSYRDPPSHSLQSYTRSQLAAAASVSPMWYVQRQVTAARRRQDRGCWSLKEQRYYYHVSEVDLA